ncbi:conjugal transfer protein [Streptococcus pneumoniae]|uniref:Conjugal transfer protein n=4 Tax=Bacillota TaxID=1239 RepID=A0A9X0WM50_9STRE|nr:conjugal transfer protein [Enterococcus faecalis]AUC46911.1 conjugal transfer protein [Streptococcus pneumoniae]AYF95777.1 conjugal transfer protein [Streptococcus gwangjuense]KAF3371194.1 conjugal transfer protein [Enterococcus faecium]MBK4779126.1 conjugal transfer protein [Streptococcus lactarius]OOC98073.1 conjugal transfer protein [Enterococcus faecalis ATCC 29212]OOO67679.1 conjugal transfer protein [Clostridium tepidum]OOR87001.1 conjugal transfer protein [Streptococcus pseudopneum
MHGSHVAILIACDGFITLGLLTVWEYHYHDKNVVAGNPAKDCFSDH